MYIHTHIYERMTYICVCVYIYYIYIKEVTCTRNKH